MFCSQHLLNCKHFRVRTCAHVPTAFPLSFLHGLLRDLLFAFGGTLLVARGKRPYVSWGYRRLELPCGASTVFQVACLPLMFTLCYIVVVSGPHMYFA